MEGLGVEWFNSSTVVSSSRGTHSGGGRKTFTASFKGDAVLYIYASHDTVS
jgi:hypothetical protein